MKNASLYNAPHSTQPCSECWNVDGGKYQFTSLPLSFSLPIVVALSPFSSHSTFPFFSFASLSRGYKRLQRVLADKRILAHFDKKNAFRSIDIYEILGKM